MGQTPAIVANAPRSRLSTDVDFEAEGKQTGFLRLPHSVNRSAYGWLPVPVVCVKHGEGPTVLFMSGVHGDEFEGQVALSRLARTLEPAQISGRVIIVPMANFPAAEAGTRVSPIDDVNMNRVFPGRADGSPTLQLAHYLETELMPLADYVFDLHSGGSSLHYLPTTLLLWSEDERDRARQIDFANAMGTPFACFFQGDHGGASSSAAALRQGASGVTVELGGSGIVSIDALTCCETGISGLLDLVGVRPRPDSSLSRIKPRIVQAMGPSSYAFSLAAGVFEPVVSLGDEVEAGQLAAYVHHPDTPWVEPHEVYFEASGVVICRRAIAKTQPGDCLFHLGCPSDDSSPGDSGDATGT